MYTKLDQSNRKTQSGKFHFFLEFCLLFLQVAVVSMRPFWDICNAFYSMEYTPVVNTHIQRSDVERTSFIRQVQQLPLKSCTIKKKFKPTPIHVTTTKQAHQDRLPHEHQTNHE